MTSESKIGYIRRQIPAFEIPPYRGQRYEAMVPDTLDLAQRAELAINGLTGPTDPEADYEIYFIADFFRHPPVVKHDWSDHAQARFMEALPLLRVATGSDLNEHVDPVWMESLLKSIGPDGLIYTPTEGRPWARVEIVFANLFRDTPGEAPCLYRADGTVTDIMDESVTQFAHKLHGNFIGAMTIYYLRDHNPMWKEIIEKMVQRLSDLAIHKDDYCYFPAGLFEPNAKLSPDAAMPKEWWSVEGGGAWEIMGLADFYKVTGYEPAIELAGKLTRYLKDHAQWYDHKGRFIKDGKLGGHYHMHSYGLMAMLEYAVVTGDQELIDYAKSGFEWATTQGCSLVGFFPENLRTHHPNCEICEVADMITMALRLTNAGAGDYWDDVDRWVRNVFAEEQLTSSDWVERIALSSFPKAAGYNESDERVAERNLGAYAGWASGSDWALRGGIMHCCTGEGARALYYVWENILHFKDGKLQVNLLLNRASPWADVDSYIPYEGQVDLKIKQPCKEVMLRVPQWIDSGSEKVACTVNGKVRKVNWQGRYVNLGAAKPDDRISVSFPIWERTVKEVLGGVLYTLVIKGNEVVFIDPPGKHCPLYQRAHYRQNQVRWRKVERFSSDENIEW